MTVFVLVAGAFHGAWAWKRVGALLATGGHEVHRIDLTGQGARAHTVTPDTDLSTHIADVIAHVEMEDLTGIVLVGHSYSGMVVAGAADKLGPKVDHLVFLDAMTPIDGQSAANFSGPAMTKIAENAADGHWLVSNFFPLSKFGPFRDAEEQAWFEAKFRPHPMKTFFEPIQLRNPPPKSRSFIHLTLDPMGLFDKAAADAKASADWGYHEIETGHDAMLTAPAELAELLSALA
jgi:pimeloyl-ACP methyl ester carboxylesterase